MIWTDLVREVVGDDLTDGEADEILWEDTPFPMTSRPAELYPYLERVLWEKIARSTHLGAL